jgi:hypothetical protein
MLARGCKLGYIAAAPSLQRCVLPGRYPVGFPRCPYRGSGFLAMRSRTGEQTSSAPTRNFQKGPGFPLLLLRRHDVAGRFNCLPREIRLEAPTHRCISVHGGTFAGQV